MPKSHDSADIANPSMVAMRSGTFECEVTPSIARSNRV